MREILFRGKRIDNGEWAYGSFLQVEHEDGSFTTAVFSKKDAGGDAEVAPSTVGQYTGLTDKSGKRIFEGDIVRYTERRLGGEDISVMHPVTFDEGGFCAHHYFLNNWLRNGLCGNTKLEDIEVIGNVHDNPESRKEEEGTI